MKIWALVGDDLAVGATPDSKMPELPDVENFKRYIDSTSLHRRIEHTEVRDRRVLDAVSATEVDRSLKGHRFESGRRHGKHLFIATDGGPWLVLHFGMTGRVATLRAGEEEPRHTRFLASFEDGSWLAFVCQRLFGRIGLTPDPEQYIRDKGLGPDALALTEANLAQRLERSRGAVKGALMDQSLLAGIGNVYSDEILFQAGIHPATKVGILADRDLKRLSKAARRVLETAIAKHADPQRFPSGYLTPRRHDGEDCPRCGGRVEKMTVSGRSSYYCPNCQRKQTGED